MRTPNIPTVSDVNSQAVALYRPPGRQWATRCPGLFLALLVRKKYIFCSIVTRKGFFFVFPKKNNQKIMSGSDY